MGQYEGSSCLVASMSNMTEILSAIGKGDQQAASRLLPLVYGELRRLAAQRLAHEAPGQTLQPTALVHEAYLRLVGTGDEPHWDGRGHFFAAAAEAMRRILVENARRKHRVKRGGTRQKLNLGQIEAVAAAPSEELLALDEALNLLAVEDGMKAELVKLRYFAGMTVEEAARCLGISRATADRYWSYARAWLYDRLRKDGDSEAK
jgi:RNA polymerase sigma factor (TIGR02999 family)